MEQWCTRRICLQNQNSQKNYGRKGWHPSLGTEGLLKLRYINVLKFEKSQKIYAKEVPLFHLVGVIHLIISTLNMVELGWNYGWNYMKFHP